VRFILEFPKKWRHIIQKATQKKKKDRYQSCEELNNDIKSKNVVVPKVTETSTPKHVVKKEKNSKLTPVISVVLLFVIIGFIGFYNNYQAKLETQRQEIKDLRLEKEKAEQEILAEEKRLADKKAEQEILAEEKRLADKKAKQEILGCWTLYYTWPNQSELEAERCHNNNGTYGFYMGDNRGTWKLINNSYSCTVANGTRYTGTYRNGIITGIITNAVPGVSSRRGTFKLVKK
jgi:hypothetical protein